MEVHNYSVIYQISYKDNSIIDSYVGKTTDYEARKNAHKNGSNDLNNNLKLYKFIRDHGGWNDWKIIEEFDNISDIGLHKRERYWIIELKTSLNCNIPSDIGNLNYYECYNCEYKCNNKTMMSRHLSNKYKCKSIRDIEIDLNECKEYILNKVSYEDYLKIIEKNNNTNNNIDNLNIINNKLENEKQELNNNKLEWINEKQELINIIQELKQELTNNKLEWINEKKELININQELNTEFTNEIKKLNKEIQELNKEFINNKLKWVNAKQELININQELNKEFTNEIKKLNKEIQELNKEFINNKLKWVNEKEKLLSKIYNKK